ncbi:MAG: PfkB family carbohydrate kinase [Alphaproteobacteria bacterium]
MKNLMIIVFGSVSMDIFIETPSIPAPGETVYASSYEKVTGGKAANQALAAARSGAQVSLVGKVGDDVFGTAIVNRLKREGISTAGVVKSERPTGSAIYLRENGQTHTILALSANDEISEEQVPEEALNEKSFLLLQTEIRAEENAAMLDKAKRAGAATIMNFSPALDLSQKILKNLDYLIVNQNEAKKMAEKLGLGADSANLSKIAKALAQLGHLHCIITQGAQGCVGYAPEGAGWAVGALPLEGNGAIDPDGAEDAYCGTFAACLQNEVSFPEALKRASVAAALTCAKPGAQNALPHLADIEEHLGKLPDAESL